MPAAQGPSWRKQRYRHALVLAVMVALAVDAGAAMINGVLVPERTTVSPGRALVLNGAGVRSEASLERYVAALYLPARRGTAREVFADPGFKRVRLTALRDLRAAALTHAMLENIAENHTASELESLKAPLDELAALLNRIGKVRSGASIDFDYIPGEGTRVSVAGAAATSPIRGDDLYSAILRVWIGPDPIDRRLRVALLGVS